MSECLNDTALSPEFYLCNAIPHSIYELITLCSNPINKVTI